MKHWSKPKTVDIPSRKVGLVTDLIIEILRIVQKNMQLHIHLMYLKLLSNPVAVW